MSEQPDIAALKLSDAAKAGPLSARRERRAAAHRILHLSETMLLAARDGHWTRVSEIEPERQQLAWDFFAHPLSPLDAAELGTELDRVLQISRELTQLAQQERSAVASAGAQLTRGQHAAHAYGNHDNPW